MSSFYINLVSNELHSSISVKKSENYKIWIERKGKILVIRFEIKNHLFSTHERCVLVCMMEICSGTDRLLGVDTDSLPDQYSILNVNLE